MELSSRPLCCAMSAATGSAALACALLVGSVSPVSAEPTPEPSPTPVASLPPNCTAADLAQVSAGVASATADYRFSHPDVNNFFTSLHGLPNNEIRGDIHNYLSANPYVQSDLTRIRQPLVDLRTRCE